MLKQPLPGTYTFQTCPCQKGCPLPAMRTPAQCQEVSAPSLEEAAFSSLRSPSPSQPTSTFPQRTFRGSRWSRGQSRPSSSGSPSQCSPTAQASPPLSISMESASPLQWQLLPCENRSLHSPVGLRRTIASPSDHTPQKFLQAFASRSLPFPLRTPCSSEGHPRKPSRSMSCQKPI